MTAALTASRADPRDFAEAMLRIIETPKGLRAVRYRVGQGAKGVEAINAVSAQAREEFLTALDLAEVTTLRR